MNSIHDLLSEIKARAEKATPGPGPGPWPWWHHYSNEDGHWVIQSKQVDWRECQVDFEFRNGEDAEFLSHARTDIPRLVAALERAIEQRDANSKMSIRLDDENTERFLFRFHQQDAEIEAILKGETK